MAKVIIGVDPHKLSATIEVVDSHEKLLGSGRFSTDPPGYTAMRAYAKTWPERIWAVEGSNGAGRPLAQRLLEAGEHVVDVPTCQLPPLGGNACASYSVLAVHSSKIKHRINESCRLSDQSCRNDHRKDPSEDIDGKHFLPDRQ